MGVLSDLIGLGPLLLSGVIILLLLTVFLLPSLAPYAPFVGVIFPALLLGALAWRRSTPSVLRLRGRLSSTELWAAAAPDLRLLKVVTVDRELARRYPTAGKVLLFEDRSALRGYACKVLRVADMAKTMETTTRSERETLLDRMAKAVQGLGDAEAKLVIERTPEGEHAYIILWTEVSDGDEKAAVYGVQHAAKTLQDSMEPLGIILLDDISYMEPFLEVTERAIAPAKVHAYALASASLATMVFSALSLGAGLLSHSILASSLIGLVVAAKLNSAAKRMACKLCGGRPHVHASLGRGSYWIGRNGLLVHERGGRRTYSRFLVFTGNANRDLPHREVKKRMEGLLMTFSNMIYALRDFRIAIHVKPQPSGDVLKVALARADWYGMDAQVGGAVSGYFKASKSMNLADRIQRGERPYILSGVVEVRATVQEGEEWRVGDLLDKQLKEAQSLLDSMNIYTGEVRDGWGALLCLRFMYLPALRTGGFESNPIKRIKALTRDFIAISPLAFKRRPFLPKDGIYLGRDEVGRRIYWNPNYLDNPHVLVLGPPGKGKSTLIKTMIFRIHQLARYTGTGRPPSIVIIDPAGEYADKADDLREQGVEVTVIDLVEKKYNPLLLSGIPPNQRAGRLVDFILANIMSLHRFQAGVLYDAIMLAYRKLCGIDPNDPKTWSDEAASKATLRHIYEYIAWMAQEAAKKVAAKGGSPELDPAASLISDLARALAPMATGAFGLDRTDFTVRDLLERPGVVIVSFKTRAAEGMVKMADQLQKLVVWSLLDHLSDYLTTKQAEEGVRVMVVIDEGHKFLKGRLEDVPLSQQLRELRKFGASYVMITHLPQDLPPNIREIVGTIFVFGFGDPVEADIVKDLLGLTKEEKERLMGLQTGELYVKWMNDPRPLYFRVEPDPRALVHRREEKIWRLYHSQ